MLGAIHFRTICHLLSKNVKIRMYKTVILPLFVYVLETWSLALIYLFIYDCLFGLAVRVPGCRPRGPGFNSRHYQIFLVQVGRERGPLSLMRITEELFGRKVVAPV
jgi:hypothetical protein